MGKVNVNSILVNPERTPIIFNGEDDKFHAKNPYGYITNLKDPEIYQEYVKFSKKVNAKVLSDNERFHFDMLMVMKFRPNLKQEIEAELKSKGSYIRKLIAKCADVGYFYDPDGCEKAPFLVRTADGDNSLRTSNPMEAITNFTERAETSLRKAAKAYCETHGLNPYTGEEEK